MILQVIREANLLGVETRVVLPNEVLFDAAEATGFAKFYKVFLTELTALDDLDITNFYPLVLFDNSEFDPDPIAA